MVAFLWILAAVMAVAMIVLATPVRLHGRLQTAPRLTYRIDARLLGGHAPRLRVLDSNCPAKAKHKAKPKKKTAKGKKGRWSPNVPALLAALPDLFTGLLGAFEVEQLEMDITFGLGDPAHTGTCFGALMPLQYGCGPVRRHVAIQPDFSRACLGGELDTVVYVTPIKLVTPLIRFVWAVFGARS